MLNPTCCIRLATSSNTVQHCPTMLDSTMLDDVASVWPGLKLNCISPTRTFSEYPNHFQATFYIEHQYTNIYLVFVDYD